MGQRQDRQRYRPIALPAEPRISCMQADGGLRNEHSQGIVGGFGVWDDRIRRNRFPGDV